MYTIVHEQCRSPFVTKLDFERRRVYTGFKMMIRMRIDMSNLIQALEAEMSQKAIPSFAPGDTVIVKVIVKEGNNQRIQAFEGVVIARRNNGFNSSFTVRKISHGEGVERVFPLYSPLVDGIEVKRRGDVRRAKLYYLRDRSGRSARIREKLLSKDKAAIVDAAVGDVPDVVSPSDE